MALAIFSQWKKFNGQIFLYSIDTAEDKKCKNTFYNFFVEGRNAKSKFENK